MTIIGHFVYLIGIALASALSTSCFAADPYPTKPIKLVIGIAAGATADGRARLLAEKVSAELGQNIIVVNRPGASGTIAAESVASAASDGYTLLYGLNYELALAPAFGQKISYDPEKSFEPVTGLAVAPFLLFSSSRLQIRTIDDLVAATKASPGKLAYGSSGNVSIQHLLGELLSKKIGIQLTHVPYKGNNQTMNDLLGGHIQLAFDVVASALPQVQAGKIVPLMALASKRSLSFPDTPTAKELGIEGLDVGAWFGILAPANTPRDVISKLNGAFINARRSADYMKMPGSDDQLDISGPPDSFAAFMKVEREKLNQLIKTSGITLSE
jgi:tripartite-type tricarboxylate transporter receptor subunit TctC